MQTQVVSHVFIQANYEGQNLSKYLWLLEIFKQLFNKISEILHWLGTNISLSQINQITCLYFVIIP